MKRRVCEGCGEHFDPRKPKGQTRARMKSRRYCSRECSFLHRVETTVERIMRRVAQQGECWLWTGARQPNGYGVIGKGRRGEGIERVHRAMYEATHGTIDDDAAIVHHTCRNRACVNPGHLVLVENQGAHMALHAQLRGGDPNFED